MIPGFSRANHFPAVITTAERCRLPKNGLTWIIEARRRDTDDGKRSSVHPNCGPKGFRIASEKGLPESVTDHGNGVPPCRSHAGPIYIVPRSERPPQDRLRAKHREEIRRHLDDMGPTPFA
jgi:hypothetical protein